MPSSPHGNGARDAREDMKVEGSMCKAYHLVASVTELIVGLCRRESNQPRPGVAPGDPQHEAEGWTWCPRGRENADDAVTRPSVFVRESKHPAKTTYSRMDLVERGLPGTMANANHSERDPGSRLCGAHICVCAAAACMQQIIGLCGRDLDQPRTTTRTVENSRSCSRQSTYSRSICAHTVECAS